MAMHLRETLSNRWDHVQNFLFPPAILNGAPGAKIFGFLGFEFLIQG
jgi:hypothetical protein